MRHMAYLGDKYTPVDYMYEQRANIFWKVEAVRVQELREIMPLSYSYLVGDVWTPLYKARGLL